MFARLRYMLNGPGKRMIGMSGIETAGARFYGEEEDDLFIEKRGND